MYFNVPIASLIKIKLNRKAVPMGRLSLAFSEFVIGALGTGRHRIVLTQIDLCMAIGAGITSTTRLLAGLGNVRHIWTSFW